jgi:hypothetical protein
MDRAEFETLRDLPHKQVVDDITFTPKNATTLVFQDVPVANALGLDLVLNGSFKPDIPAVKYNFSIKGVGPICRVDVNGSIHGTEGRTHKHDLQTDSCPRKNLPTAKARPDLERLTALQVWQKVCAMANIQHTGRFEEPEV